MARIPQFLSIERRPATTRPVSERVNDYREVAVLRAETDSQAQASRCLNCGLPFCHWSCPLGNYVPDWNDFLARERWEDAYRVLQATNNMPEITARVCPASCEYACVLGINDGAVTIRENELAVIEHAFRSGWVRARPPQRRTGKSVAVIGSGPAGLACADQLNKVGHRVVVFERDDKPGGILRYGIPDFKLEKWVIDRRLQVWRAEGVVFITGMNVGIDYPASTLMKEFDAVCLAIGSRVPRDLPVEGRTLRGVHFAMEYLTQSNRRVMGERMLDDRLIDAKGKRVVVLGGGDTGADCVGTAHRQGAARVTQIELLPKPPEPGQHRSDDFWPNYPPTLKTSSSHEEGGVREWAVLTKRFLGAGGSVKKLSCIRVAFDQRDSLGRIAMRELPGTEFEVSADLVLLAMGFVAPESSGLVDALQLPKDARGNLVTTPEQQTAVAKVFAAGDARRGQSLVAWAVVEGRRAAHAIDTYLMGSSRLPRM